jgi:hypothetical protein
MSTVSISRLALICRQLVMMRCGRRVDESYNLAVSNATLLIGDGLQHIDLVL